MLDPEDLRALLARYYGIAKDVVVEHGGTLEKSSIWATPITWTSRDLPCPGGAVMSTSVVRPAQAVHWKHMATAIRPPIWDEAVADEHRTVNTDEAIGMARRLAREEGIFSGPSGGGAVAVAIAVAREHEGLVVALLADSGERYLSTPMWE